MPSVPNQVSAAPVPDPDDITLCEVSCRLVGTRDAQKTGCTKGLTLPSIQVDLDAVEQAFAQHVPVVEACRPPQNGAKSGSKQAEQQSSSEPFKLLKWGANFVLSRLGLPTLFQFGSGPCTPSLLAWHCNQQHLAIGHQGSGAVLMYDLGEAAGASNDAGQGRLTQCQQVLTHQFQQQVGCLAWRPVHCSMLAVGCSGGVALWTLGKLPLTAANIHRGAENGRAAAEGAAATAAQGGGWVTFLPFKQACRVTSLSWSPDGRLLAGSSTDCNRVVVWDVALGVGSNLRLGLEPITCLSWSPDGSYLFAAARSGRFFLYETSTWSLRSWDTPPGSAVTAAVWAPDATAVLLALSNSSCLVALYLVGSPPNLTEQLLPVMLPGVSDMQQEEHSSCIQSLAWDPQGNRLAVVLSDQHPAAGTVALYSTHYSPVIECNLVGFVQPGVHHTAGATAAADPGNEDSKDEPKVQLHAAFAPIPGRAKAVLSLGQCSNSEAQRGSWGLVRNIPLYF